MSRFTGTYTDDWKSIAKFVKDEADWKCVRCGHPHDPASGHTLTVHHLDNNKSNVVWYNLVALDQKCHLVIQGKVRMDRPWLFEHTDWFKPYAGAFFAHKYLGLELTREEVMTNLEYYASLERNILVGQRR